MGWFMFPMMLYWVVFVIKTTKLQFTLAMISSGGLLVEILLDEFHLMAGWVSIVFIASSFVMFMASLITLGSIKFLALDNEVTNKI